MYKAEKGFVLPAALLAMLLMLSGAGMRDTDAETPYTPAAQKSYEQYQESLEKEYS